MASIFLWAAYILETRGQTERFPDIVAGGAPFSPRTLLGGLPFALFAKGGPLFSSRCSSGRSDRRRIPRIHVQQRAPAMIKAPTAPRPITGMLHEFLFYGILVHVVQLLDHFRSRIDVEIVVAALPEAPQRSFLGPEVQRQLSLGLSPSAAHAARQTLLEDLQDLGRRRERRFADQQMDVIGHEDVPDQSESIARAHLAENLHGEVSGANGSKEMPALIAAEGDEMKITLANDALETLGHMEKSEAGPPFGNRKG